MTNFFLIRTVDQMRRMECSYVCEVLHFLLKKRHGTPLVKLPVDLVNVDNEASLDLLCALFKHREYHNTSYICISSQLVFFVQAVAIPTPIKETAFTKENLEYQVSDIVAGHS